MRKRRKRSIATNLKTKRENRSKNQLRGVPRGWSSVNFKKAMAAQLKASREIVRSVFMSDDLEDKRVEDVLTEMHAIASAQYTVDPLTGKKVKIVNGSDPLGFTYPTKDRIAAAKLFLDFKKAKPAQKHDHQVTTAEDFLDALADADLEDVEDDEDQSSTPEDNKEA